MVTVDFRYFPLQAGDWVLDLGCGEGRHAIEAYVRANVNIVGVDIAHSDLTVARDRWLPFRQAENSHKAFYLQRSDALRLPFVDGSFDKVICSEVLEHLPEYRQVLAEVFRVLKPGGLLAVSVPRSWPEQICWWLSAAYHQVEGGHLRIFNARHLRRDIEQQGFRFFARHWAHALHSPYWWLKCLWWNHGQEPRLLRLYHRLLVWDLLQRPWITRSMERLLNPLLGKSVVMYFQRCPITEAL